MNANSKINKNQNFIYLYYKEFKHIALLLLSKTSFISTQKKTDYFINRRSSSTKTAAFI